VITTTPERVERTYQYRGQTKEGSLRIGSITTGDLAEFVRIRHLAGWQWLEAKRDGVLVAEITAGDRKQWVRR
jgi:hypothetical protein